MYSTLKKWVSLLVVVCMLCSLCVWSVTAETTATGSTGVQGDANGDGVFNMKDVLTLRKYLAGLVDNIDKVGADLNLDDGLNMKDVLLMRLMSVGYEVINGTISTTATTTATTTTAPTPASQIQQTMLELVNAEREKAGLTALSLDEKLCAAAEIRAKEVASKFNHIRPNGKDDVTVLDDLGIQYVSFGENIAKGYETAKEIFTEWMKSADNKEYILSARFTHMGVAYNPNKDCWAQLFMTKTGSIYPADPETTLNMNLSLLTAINSVRSSKGLEILTSDAALQAAATTLAKEQGTMGKMSFTRPDGSKYSTVLTTYNISYETLDYNVAFYAGCKTLEDALAVWAPKNDYSLFLNKSHTRIGIGYDETTGYWSILLLD